MKQLLCALLLCTLNVAMASSFAPLQPEERFGPGIFTWRFSSNLTAEAKGVLEFCYAETGNQERVLGRVDIRSFRSSEARIPNLQILFTTAMVDGKKQAILIVGYGLRSGTFVVEVPGLTSHSLVATQPQESAAGEYSLLGFGDRVMLAPNSMEGTQGRLFFRYVESI